MPEEHVAIYRERGEQLSQARRLLETDQEFRSATALVSVHSGISFNDALLARIGQSALHSESHEAAAAMIERECKKRKINNDGVKHLKKLLKAKTNISYSPERVTQDISSALAVAAERFETWFHQTIRELQ